MRLYIDSTELRLLLERKRSYIGVKDHGVAYLVDALLLLFSAYTTSIDGANIWELVVKTTFCIVAIGNIVIAAQQIYESTTHNYSKDMLCRDIEALDMQERRSSIIAIKNPVNPRKYLVYYDPQWQFMLFPNYTTRDYANETSICEALSRDLSIPAADIHVQFITSGTEQKYATAHHETRSYDYYFYVGSVNGIDSDDFTVDNRAYKWMTIDELLADPDTCANNRYIVDRVGKDC